MLPTNTSWGRCVYCSSVNTCQLVCLLSINEVTASVSWSFVCQFKLTCFSHLHTMTLSRLSYFITTRLGRMKAWVACNSLDWVTCFPLHFTLQVVYIHVHYGVHREMYIGIDSRLIDSSLCCIICFQIKKIRVLVAKPELLISCHPNKRQSAVCFPGGPRDSIPWL